MKLKELMQSMSIINLTGPDDIEVEGIVYNSTLVAKGYIFVAIEGFKRNGHQYIYEAVSKGAKGIVVSRDVEAIPGITVIRVIDTRKALSRLSANLYNNPSKALQLIGITGTNGKTTTSYMLKSILDKTSRRVGLIGTIETIINDKSDKASLTTPESLELQKKFQLMRDDLVDTCVMEVSSHAIKLQRVNDCDFNVGVFTNLTHEHLDFHGNMENYYQTKRELFYKTKDFNIVNIDDAMGNRLAKEIKQVGPMLLTYGLDNNADIMAYGFYYTDCFTQFGLITPLGNITIKIKFPGLFNVYNSLAAAACGYAMGLELEQIKKGLEEMEKIPGRFEVVPTDKNIKVIIDYAHTPDGFKKMLDTINEFAMGRKIIVFGCVGERDHTKRSKMGEIAAEYCDLCILTTDNCRSEDPSRIIDDIKEGFRDGVSNYIQILDRADAIRYAIQNSKENDTIIITGKGHEQQQIIGENIIPFNERDIIKSALEGELLN